MLDSLGHTDVSPQTVNTRRRICEPAPATDSLLKPANRRYSLDWPSSRAITAAPEHSGVFSKPRLTANRYLRHRPLKQGRFQHVILTAIMGQSSYRKRTGGFGHRSVEHFPQTHSIGKLIQTNAFNYAFG